MKNFFIDKNKIKSTENPKIVIVSGSSPNGWSQKLKNLIVNKVFLEGTVKKPVCKKINPENVLGLDPFEEKTSKKKINFQRTKIETLAKILEFSQKRKIDLCIDHSLGARILSEEFPTKISNEIQIEYLAGFARTFSNATLFGERLVKKTIQGVDFNLKKYSGLENVKNLVVFYDEKDKFLNHNLVDSLDYEKYIISLLAPLKKFEVGKNLFFYLLEATDKKHHFCNSSDVFNAPFIQHFLPSLAQSIDLTRLRIQEVGF